MLSKRCVLGFAISDNASLGCDLSIFFNLLVKNKCKYLNTSTPRISDIRKILRLSIRTKQTEIKAN